MSRDNNRHLGLWLGGAALALIAWVAVSAYPEFQRYMKIRAM